MLSLSSNFLCKHAALLKKNLKKKAFLPAAPPLCKLNHDSVMNF